jgi:hypothetical protein
VAEREIVAVVWHEHTHSIDVVYDEGHPDTLMGTRKMAAQMAEGFGLDPVPTDPGTILWVREPGPSPSPGS